MRLNHSISTTFNSMYFYVNFGCNSNKKIKRKFIFATVHKCSARDMHRHTTALDCTSSNTFERTSDNKTLRACDCDNNILYSFNIFCRAVGCFCFLHFYANNTPYDVPGIVEDAVVVGYFNLNSKNGKETRPSRNEKRFA